MFLSKGGGVPPPLLWPKERGRGSTPACAICQIWKKIEGRHSLERNQSQATKNRKPLNAFQATMQAIQAIQARQIGIQATVPVMPTEESQSDKGIDHPIQSCWDCNAVWRSYEPSRCPGCARHVGDHWDANEEETSSLMYAVALLSEERIERASEYETWAFGNILRENVIFYNETCRRTIQTCYEALLKQPSNPKVAFAIGFFKEAYLQAPEDEMTVTYDDEEEEYHSWTDEEDW